MAGNKSALRSGMTTPHTLPENGNVHVWCFEGTGLSSDLAQSLSETLSSDERLAIARFRDARLREYRTAGRAMLRQVLSSYLRVPMATVVLGVGRHGKPLVVTPQAHCLQFNVSHSDAITLIAVANGQEVGIDVERVRGAGAFVRATGSAVGRKLGPRFRRSAATAWLQEANCPK